MRKMLLIGGLAALMAAGLIASGCLISPPDYPNKAANILKLNPKNLERLPKGSIYEGWLANGEVDQEGVWQADDISEWVSFGRFNWDDYNHQPIDAGGNFIENRFDAKVNVCDYDYILITIESTGRNETPLPSGIVLLQGEVDLFNDDADLEHPISTSEISDFQDENFFYIYSQSDGVWYDTLTGDDGIWFGEAVMEDRYDYDTLYRDLCIDTVSGDTAECAEGEEPDLIDTVVNVTQVPNGDTTVTPSLETMPPAVDGWKYEAWIMFTEDSHFKPLSLGRFSDPAAPDDDSSHCNPPRPPGADPDIDTSGYDWNFNIPGEDFFNKMEKWGGPLSVVDNPYTEKLFITVEPDPDFDPDNPYKQLIMFSAYLPTRAMFYQVAGVDTTQRPYTRQFPLIVRDIGYEINEGHRWPEMHIDLEREMIVSD